MNQSAQPSPPSRRAAVLFRVVISIVLVLAAVLAVVFVARMKQREEVKPPPQETVVNVRVETVEAAPALADVVELPAVVEPNYVVRVSAEVAGRIEKVLLKEGARCEKGALLMILNTDLIQASYDRAKADAELAQAQYGRVRELVAGGAATQQEMDQATATLAVSRAALAAAKAELDRARILAPSAGILNDLLIEEGEYVQVGRAVAEIVDVDTVKVAVQVPERDVTFFKEGDPATVLYMPNGATTEIASAIRFISRRADPATRSTRMEIHVDNAAGSLHSGQIVTVRLTRRVIENALMIPLLAVIPQENAKAVYVVQDGLAERRSVTLGIIRGVRVQVLDGLQPGDSLIVAGHRFVGPGQRVRVVTTPDAAVGAKAEDAARQGEARLP